MSVLIRPTSNNTFKVMADCYYKDIHIPIGFETNGADSPRLFWVIVPPFKPKILPAIILHDYMIATSKSKADIIKANTYFSELLLILDNSFKSKIMIQAVKAYWYLKQYKKGK